MADRALRLQEAFSASLAENGSREALTPLLSQRQAAQRLLNNRDRIGKLQIHQQAQTVVDLDELRCLLGTDRCLELRIVLSSKVGS